MSYRRRAISLAILAVLFLLGCNSNSTEKEAAVPVQVVTVKKETLQRTVTAEAVLFPLQQAAITPKISAPVKAFYIKRGSKVRKGQLLAVLENRDLAAAAQENKGSYDQAQAAYETTTAADLPQEVQKAQLDAQAARQLLSAQQKVYNSRQELFQQGAMPRKELDQAGVDLTNARNQYEIAQTASRRPDESRQAAGAEVGGGTTRVRARQIPGRGSTAQLLRNSQPH